MTTIRTCVCSFLILGFLTASFPDKLLADQQPPGTGDPAAGFRLTKGAIELAGTAGTTVQVSWLRAHPNRRLTMGTFQLGRVMTNQRSAGSFELMLEVTPLMILRQPDQVFGIAASPLHMRWNVGPASSRPVRAFAEASGGILWTSEAVPPGTTTFNFIDQAGFGVRIGRSSRRAWLFGYRFQHISNGGRVKPNPGANFNFVYAGLTFLK